MSQHHCGYSIIEDGKTQVLIQVLDGRIAREPRSVTFALTECSDVTHCHLAMPKTIVTRLDEILILWENFKACGKNYFAHILRQFL